VTLVTYRLTLDTFCKKSVAIQRSRCQPFICRNGLNLNGSFVTADCGNNWADVNRRIIQICPYSRGVAVPFGSGSSGLGLGRWLVTCGYFEQSSWLFAECDVCHEFQVMRVLTEYAVVIFAPHHNAG